MRFQFSPYQKIWLHFALIFLTKHAFGRHFCQLLAKLPHFMYFLIIIHFYCVHFRLIFAFYVDCVRSKWPHANLDAIPVLTIFVFEIQETSLGKHRIEPQMSFRRSHFEYSGTGFRLKQFSAII